MLNKKELLRVLHENQITVVLIGGIAMRLYNSPRVTHDLHLAVRTLDIDRITDLMYEHNHYLVTAVENDSARICLSTDEAGQWITTAKSGPITFIGLEKKPASTARLSELPKASIYLGSNPLPPQSSTPSHMVPRRLGDHQPEVWCERSGHSAGSGVEELLTFYGSFFENDSPSRRRAPVESS